MSARRRKKTPPPPAPVTAQAAAPLFPPLGPRVHVGVALALGLSLLLAYGNSFHAGFTLDNKARILEDPRVREVSSERLWRILTEDYWWPGVTGLYRPLTTLSFLFNYAILGDGGRPEGYHAINLLLHWGNVLLVYLLGLVVFRDLWRAAFTAALFGLHPITTEAVTNLVGRADLLATASIMAGLVLHVHAARLEGRRRLPWLLTLALTAALGVLSKENAATLLGVVALYDITYRFETRHTDALRNLLLHLRRFADGYLAVALGVAAVFVLRAWVFSRLRLPVMTVEDNPLVAAGFWEGRLTAVKVIGDYLGLLLWPRTLSCDYSYDQVPLFRGDFGAEDWKALGSLAAILAILAGAAASHRRRKTLFFLVFFAAGTLLPTANLLTIIGSIKADRFLYTPSIGFAGVLVLAAFGLSRRLVLRGRAAPWRERIVPSALALVAIAYGVRTHVRNRDWRDDLTLWSQAVRACPRSFKTHLSYANAVAAREPEAQQIDTAIREVETAFAITQEAELVLLYLGEYYRIKGDVLAAATAPGPAPPESIEWYRKSVDILKRAVELRLKWDAENRRRELHRGRRPEEIEDIRNAETYSTLALAYTRLGDYARGLEAYAEMRRIVPNLPGGYLGPAAIHAAAGRLEEAMRALVGAWLLDGGRPATQRQIVDLYRRLSPGGCAVAGTGPEARLNLDCPEVRGAICAGHRDLVQAFLESREYPLAEKTRESALREYQCPPGPFQD